MNDTTRIKNLEVETERELEVKAFLLHHLVTDKVWLSDADCGSNDDLLSWVECSIKPFNDESEEELRASQTSPLLCTPNNQSITYNECLDFFKKYNLMP